MFLGHTGQKSGYVHKGDDGQVETVAEAHKTGAFVRGVDIQTAGQGPGLIGHDPHRRSVQAGEADHQVWGIHLLGFKEFPVIHDGEDDFLDIVRRSGVFRNDISQFHVDPVGIVPGGQLRGLFVAILGREGKQLPDLVQGGPVILGREVRHPVVELCRMAPPRASGSTSSWVTALITCGPVMNMWLVFSTMMTKSVMAGE